MKNSIREKRDIFSEFTLVDFLLITLLGLGIGFFTCPHCFWGIGQFLKNWNSLVLSLAYTYVLGYGCSFIIYLGNKYRILEHKPVSRFFLGLGISGLFAFTASMLIIYFYVFLFYEGKKLTMSEVFEKAQLPMWIAIALVTFFSGLEYLKNWKKEAVRAEKLEKEKIATEYESLRNQVNPHFLFNTLNALTSLVYENQELAVKYIRQLSEVYRYVLDSRHKDLVNLAEELEFIKSYVFLQQIRFGTNLVVNMCIQSSRNKFILPLSLQILLENAIKHNEISAEKKLTINLHEDEDYLIVENIVNKKNTIEYSTGIGISNISERYSHLTDKKVIVDHATGVYRIKLPCLRELE